MNAKTNSSAALLLDAAHAAADNLQRVLTKLDAALERAARPEVDVADIIAGELKISRAYAYEKMRHALANEMLRELADWGEEDGDVLWWRFPLDEPPYCGHPNCDDWPGYHTHWTPLLVPDSPNHKLTGASPV